MKAHGLEIIGGLTSDNSPSSMEIDNVVDNKSIIARDHGTATVAEVGNIIYGTGSPPSANTTPIGTLFIKYIA